jgi:DUF971 family protein
MSEDAHVNDSMPTPTEIRVRRTSRVLEIVFADDARFRLPFEYLRVFSPSAEVRGHSVGEPLLVTGKSQVMVEQIEPVGNYAVQLYFDDGHSTGIYSWSTLYDMGLRYEKSWARYLERLAAAGESR